MGDSSLLIAWMVFHFAVGYAGTWLARRYALRRNLIDQPGERRSHTAATPRGGGISLVVSMMLAVVMMSIATPSSALALGIGGTGLVMVAAIGWLDDHRPLSPWLRLAVHAVSAALLAVAIACAGGGPMEWLLAFFGALVLVNVWNFMDGIDGLAASQAALVALGFVLLGGGMAWAGLALVAAICGFLPHNFPKARIFLGDVGSGALGYAVAALMAIAALAAGGGFNAWPLVLLPLSVFLIDAGFTLVRRMLRGERWWEPHVQHAYQCWARGEGQHRVVTAGYGLATMCLIFGTLVAYSSSGPTRMVMIGAVWLAGGGAWVWIQRRYDLVYPEEPGTDGKT